MEDVKQQKLQLNFEWSNKAKKHIWIGDKAE